MDVRDEVHGFVGMERHFTEAEFDFEAELAANGTNDATQGDGLAAADVEDIAAWAAFPLRG